MKGHHIKIHGRSIGPGKPVYIIAEMSANHQKDYDQAVKIIKAAKEVGADAIKLQTYTPDTITIDCDNEYFQIEGTLWGGRTLFDLYSETYTPWDWFPKLKKVADDLGINFFSTPFDETAVDFLESIDASVYKIASFECVDLPLLQSIAQTGKPIIMSTGMATLAEIDEAVRTIREAGGKNLALLKCTSAYPAPSEEINLRTIPHLAETFRAPVGLSDHTLGIAIPVASVAAGACIIEKHFTLSRDVPGPDSFFSLEPDEFKAMVYSVRTVEKALGAIRYGVGTHEQASRAFRRSLFVIQDMDAGEIFTGGNVRSIRPGFGLHTRYLNEVIGRYATQNIRRGTPLTLAMVGGRSSPQKKDSIKQNNKLC